jgi:hypothetical protein
LAQLSNRFKIREHKKSAASFSTRACIPLTTSAASLRVDPQQAAVVQSLHEKIAATTKAGKILYDAPISVTFYYKLLCGRIYFR